MSNTLRDKIIEFRGLQKESDLSAILDLEKRQAFERSKRAHDTQKYINHQQKTGYGKYGSMRLNDQKMFECDIYNSLKSSISQKRIAEERKETDETLATNLSNLNIKNETETRQRMNLRNSEPELRRLAEKIRAKINGNLLATQIYNRKKRHLCELTKEIELERQLLEADQKAQAADLAKDEFKSVEMVKAMQQAMYEQKTGTRSKDKAQKMEKEESKRLIDELIAKENEKIAKEQAIQRAKREMFAREFREFFTEHGEKKKEQKEQQRALDERLGQERDRIFERNQAFEQKKKENVDARIQIQDKMGEYTIQLQQAHERERMAYVDADEALARARAGLEELDYHQTQTIKKQELAREMQRELAYLDQVRRKQREEELQLEREQEEQNLQAMRREAAERQANELQKREKLKKDMQEQLELKRRLLEDEHNKIKQEDLEIAAKLKAQRELVDAERQAMLAEYEEYIRYWTKCNPNETFEASGLADRKCDSEECE